MAVPVIFSAAAIGSIATWVLARVGLSVVTYTGISVLLDNVKGVVIDQLSGLPLMLAQLLGISGADIAVNILFSALAVRATINSYTRLKS